MPSPWSLVKSGSGAVFKAVKFVTTPVWLPAKSALNFVKDHKLLTTGIAAGAFVVAPTLKKMNHPGQTIDIGCEHREVPEVVESNSSSEFELGQ